MLCEGTCESLLVGGNWCPSKGLTGSSKKDQGHRSPGNASAHSISFAFREMNWPGWIM